MEMEGRGFSELLVSTTEEILIKSMMDNPIENPVPNMEMLGFKNLMQPFRADSEELFNTWLINGESPTSAITHHPRQASTRISADHGSSQRNAVSFTKKSSNGYTSHQNFIASDEHLSHPGQYSLRRKYDAVQDSQVKVVPQARHNMPAHGIHHLKEDFSNMSNLCNIPMAEMPNQLQKFMSPFNSSAPYNPRIATPDAIFSLAGRSYGVLTSQEAAASTGSIQRLGNQAAVFHNFSPAHVPGLGSLATIEKSLELTMGGFPTEGNHIQMSTVSREPSQSDSSTAAPELSAGFEAFDGTVQSRPVFNTCGDSGNHAGYGSLEFESRDKEFKERLLENGFKDSRKRENLAWMDSISSGASVGKEDSTKKRRVERSRKMAEAKEKSSTPSQSSDMQGILKRWENLEKEVRSLKLNLSFMNRKDSEQTKQIEDLQKQNEELTKEKERLLDEIEQNLSLPDKI